MLIISRKVGLERHFLQYISRREVMEIFGINVAWRQYFFKAKFYTQFFELNISSYLAILFMLSSSAVTTTEQLRL